MGFVDGIELRRRTTRSLNFITITWLSARMTVVLWLRRLGEGVALAPFALRRRLTPIRVVVGLGLTGLIAAPTTLYVVEKGRHVDTLRAYRELTVASTTETRYLLSTLRDLLDEQSRLAHLVLESGNTLYAGNKVYVKVLATGYSSSVAETDATPFVTAANTSVQLGVVAFSQDLLREYTPGAPFSFGDRVHVSGLGDFLVQDSMNPRWANRIDVWFPSREEAVRFGIREVVMSRTLDEGSPIRDEILSGNYSAEAALGGL